MTPTPSLTPAPEADRRAAPGTPSLHPTAKCKTHPDRAAQMNRKGQTMGSCPECVRAFAKKNGPLSGAERADLQLGRLLLDKIPVFDPQWEPEVQKSWMEALIKITEILKGEGHGPGCTD